MNTVVISGFPAVGKTQFVKNRKDLKVLDSDSSNFSWTKDNEGNNTKERNPNFPNNYIQHIKDNLGKVDVILVSSHDIVRKALEDNEIKYYLVYPDKDLKEEYIDRYIVRGNNTNFIDFINDNWDKFIDDIDNETFPLKIKLSKGTYLTDIYDYIRG